MRPTVTLPESVTWRIHLDRAMWVAGVRALMLQALHPVAMQGVWQRSDFMRDPMERLLRIAHFVAITTYGSPEEAEALGRRVRAVHHRLSFTDPATGEQRRVDEHDLLVWVHCAEAASYLEVVARAGLPLTRGDADRYLAEQSHTATYVGLTPADVPTSVGEMREYLAGVRPALRATPEAKQAVRFLLWPTVPERLKRFTVLKPAWFPIGALAYYCLPAWARHAYGVLPEFPGAQAATTEALHALRQALNASPKPLYNRLFDEATVRSAEAARERLAAVGYDVRGGFPRSAGEARRGRSPAPGRRLSEKAR
ncbi:oxygenase MpaB family protein [Allosalinactinospora lopnorensis]|uniref:oxygenase MpaB family protein n=1 Tax=Allosalinactinospora lopnorensis TaxID=1352348 RepID=UPI000623EFEB|nr:oxygenase MpaB family protein [Allosalinactinospora lopnorensis]